MKRLYTIVMRRKRDGFVDAHIYDCLNVPALAFATGYWNGEQLPNAELKSEALPLDRFRAEFMGRNIGVPADLLFYKLREYGPSVAIAILHDVPVRCESDSNFKTIARIYRIRDTFGCGAAEFHGYWEPDSPITVAGESCYASYWRHPANGVLIAVSNLSQQAQAVRVAADLGRLGLADGAKAVDMLSEASPTVEDGVFTASLPPQSWALIRLR
jgi:hypothetical protein